MPLVSLMILAAALLLSNQPIQQATPDPSATAHDNSQSSTAQPPAQDQHTEANRRIRDSINDALSSDVVLNGAHVKADVDDQNITLNGDVRTFDQHQRVLQLVHPFGRWRRIVDNLQMK
jgi:osmotically-inducible protein OsmY